MKVDEAGSNSSTPGPKESVAADAVSPFWCQYVEEAGKYDKAFLEKNKIKMEGVLVFAGLFSAVTASFLIPMQATLSPNPSDTTNALLMMIAHSIDNSTFVNQTLPVGIPTWNGPAYNNVLAQTLGYAALSTSLLASLGAVLGKQWLSDYAASEIGSLQERGARRQQRLDALLNWRFEAFMETLPALIQIALLLFGISLSIALWGMNTILASVVISVTGLGVSFYFVVTVTSLLYPTCPFRTPVSSTIQQVSAIAVKSVEEIAEYWSASAVRNSARRARNFIRWIWQDPHPDPRDVTPCAIAWLLRTSTHPEKLIAALELVPNTEWPVKFNLSLLGEGPHNIFARFIPEMLLLKDRVLPLGKALVVFLCRLPQCSYLFRPTAILEQLDVIISEQADEDSDRLFILTIVTKLLHLKFRLEDRGIKFPPTREISQPLLAWLLQPMEILLQLEHPRQSRFLPEAHQMFRNLQWSKDTRLGRSLEMQYLRTFEVYLNNIVGSNGEHAHKELNPQDTNKVQADQKVLEILRTIDLSHTRLEHLQDLVVPVPVLSRLASTPYLKHVFKDALISSWMSSAFEKGVGKADEGGERTWLYASCLMQLARDMDTFSLNNQLDEDPLENSDGSIDSKILSYLLNKQTPATTSPQVECALKIMLANMNEDFVLAFDPRFINYILYATGPGQVYSIRDVGQKFLVAACQALLRAPYNKEKLLTLASCDLARFLHRAILHQDPPAVLTDLLRINDKAFNKTLLDLLAPALRDPSNALLTKLRDESNKIPERELRDLEIALVLSDNEGRKTLLFDHLDHSIAMASDCHHVTTLPLTVTVGWLLRQGGAMISSEEVWKAFIRPNSWELLTPAWSDPDVLEDSPQMLQLLLNCTTRWLSTCTVSEAGTPSKPVATVTLTHCGRPWIS